MLYQVARIYTGYINFHAKDLQDHFHENPFHLFNYQPSTLSNYL